jgi:hypothetical protein
MMLPIYTLMTNANCRLHELSQLGAQSPGPGAYSTVATSPRNKAVGGWIGDAPAMVFGTGAQSSHTRWVRGSVAARHIRMCGIEKQPYTALQHGGEALALIFT